MCNKHSISDAPLECKIGISFTPNGNSRESAPATAPVKAFAPTQPYANAGYQTQNFGYGSAVAAFISNYVKANYSSSKYGNKSTGYSK